MVALGLNAFNHPWTHQESYVLPPPILVHLVLSNFLAQHVTGQFRLIILVVPCRFATILNMVEDICH